MALGAAGVRVLDRPLAGPSAGTSFGGALIFVQNHLSKRAVAEKYREGIGICISHRVHRGLRVSKKIKIIISVISVSSVA